MKTKRDGTWVGIGVLGGLVFLLVGGVRGARSAEPVWELEGGSGWGAGGGRVSGGSFAADTRIGGVPAGWVEAGSLRLWVGFRWMIGVVDEVAVPRLRIGSAGRGLLLEWDDPRGEFVVELSRSLGGRADWVVVPPPYGVEDGERMLPVVTEPGARYFRLRKR